MRRIVFGTSTLVLGLAALMSATAPVSGAKGRGGGHGGAVMAAAAVPLLTSDRFTMLPAPAPARVAPARVAPARVAPARVAPARTGPVARSGSVRSEHYAGTRSGGGSGAYGGGYGGYGGYGGGYRNPYRDDYFRRFPPGYYPYLFDGAQYYGYDDLPVGYQTVVEDGITYYLFNGIYYQAYIVGGQTVYLVVPDQIPG